MVDGYLKSEQLANAISVIRDYIEASHPASSAEKTKLLEHVDAIEFGTLTFFSPEERVGFHDFLGGFSECNYESLAHKVDWAKGYLRASTLPLVLREKEHYSDCHFDDAEMIVQKVLSPNQSHNT